MSELKNNVNLNLDEKEAEKEKKRLAREERRRAREEQMEKMKEVTHTSRPKKNPSGSQSIPKEKKELTKKQKNQIILIAIGIVIFFIIVIGLKPFIKYINTVGRDHTYDNYLLLPDVTGYTEDGAVDKLRESGFVNIKRQYIFDQFTEDGCAVKTSYHLNAQLLPDEEIIVYVCDKSLVDITNNNEKDDNNEQSTIQTPNKTYFSMDGMLIVDMAIKDDILYIIAKNNNKAAIKNINYSIGYQDESGMETGANKYSIDSDITILPGEKFEISVGIRNMYASYLYVSGFSYEKIEVPANERN